MATTHLSRRDALALLAATALARPSFARPPAICTLSIGTYSLKTMSLADAVTLVADTGYDGIEFAVMPGLAADPATLAADDRRDLAKRLADRGLRPTALMENLAPDADAVKHKAQTDRVRAAMALARDLNPKAPPLLQTILGGSGTFEAKKALFRDRVGDWLKVADDIGVVLAVKPHRGGAFSRPAEAVWLIDQLGGSKRLRMVYDYSHYAFTDMTLEGSVQTSLPVLAHVAVKDPLKQGDKVAFVLPGAGGTVDYPKLFSLLNAGGYRGDICCEVSSMVWNKAGYDPVAAAKVCYKAIAQAMETAGVPRPRSV
ncbi:MAG: sugar phosphate isomerase/epimerase [Gemmataceae bacterium]